MYIIERLTGKNGIIKADTLAQSMSADLLIDLLNDWAKDKKLLFIKDSSLFGGYWRTNDSEETCYLIK